MLRSPTAYEERGHPSTSICFSLLLDRGCVQLPPTLAAVTTLLSRTAYTLELGACVSPFLKFSFRITCRQVGVRVRVCVSVRARVQMPLKVRTSFSRSTATGCHEPLEVGAWVLLRAVCAISL